MSGQTKGKGRLNTILRPSSKIKEVLFLSPFFFPEPISTGKYNTNLVEALAKAGCCVQVICSHPFYPEWRPYFSKAQIPNVQIHRGGLCVRYPGSTILRRLVLDTWYAVHVLRKIISLRLRGMTAVAVFPPTMYFLAVNVLMRKSCKVGIVHDLQGVLSESQSGGLRRFAGAIAKWLEKQSLRRCDLVVFLSETMATQCIQAYGLRPELCTVKYPFATALTGHGGKALKPLFAKGRNHLVYSGALGEKQCPWQLLELFFRVTLKSPDTVCHVFSKGPLFDALQAEASRRGMERVFFRPLVPGEQLAELYARSSVQIIPQKLGTSGGAFPSKLPNLLNAGVPVFAISDAGSELEHVLNAVDFGRTVNSWDLEAATDALLQFLAQESLRTHLERRSKAIRYINRYFDLENLVDTILKAKDDLPLDLGACGLENNRR